MTEMMLRGSTKSKPSILQGLADHSLLEVFLAVSMTPDTLKYSSEDINPTWHLMCLGDPMRCDDGLGESSTIGNDCLKIFSYMTITFHFL